MNKKKQALIILMSIALITITLLTLDGVFLANKRVKPRYIELTSSKISENLNGFKIIYFSDVHYNLFVDDERLASTVQQINDQRPDLVLFGGDLVHNLDGKQLTQEQTQYLVEQLKSIEAHYGKFAVSGQQEIVSDYATTTSTGLLNSSEFEIINDKTLEIFYQGSSFNLIGLSPTSDQTITTSLISARKPELYTMVFTHSPNQAQLVDPLQVDYMMAGFTHGGQINIPLFNSVFFNDQNYTKKSQTIETMRLDISNGVGTDKIDMRMFSDGDFLVITLNKEVTE